MKYAKLFIYIFTIIAIIFFLYIKRDNLIYLTQCNKLNVFLLFIVALIPISINALLFYNNISIFNISLPFKKWYGLSVSYTMYNYILPVRGGIALRAMYLKQNNCFPYSQYISFTAGTYILNLFIAAFIASFLSFIFVLKGYLNKLIFFYISICLLILSVIFIILLYKLNPEKISNKNRIFTFIKKATLGIEKFKYKPKKIRNLIIIHIGFILASSLRLFIAYHILGINVSYSKLVLINSLVAFSMIFSITPGNIGIKEGILGISASLLEIPLNQALLGAVLDRIVVIIEVFILGVVFSRVLLKDLTVKSK